MRNLIAILAVAGCAVTPEPRVVGGSNPLQELIDAEGFSGAVAVVEGGTLIGAAARGWANRDSKMQNTVHTRFALASTGKLFTALAVFTLIESGDLALDDPVGRFLPNYPNRTIREKATVEHLLSMRSGLGDIFNANYERNKHRLLAHEDFLPLFVREPLSFQPGEGVAYSNAGYILLGLIIERVTGQDFYTSMQAQVFGPLGMTATGYDDISKLEPNTAVGYAVEGLDGIAESPQHRGGRPLVPNTQRVTGRGTAAGGGYSTLADFARLDIALREGRLISRESVAAIFGRDLTEAVGIAGGAPGVSTAYRMLPSGRSVIVLGNQDLPSAPAIAKTVVEQLATHSRPLVRQDGL
ncbi:MAG: serine hydrolase domain-containing protein [Myxococcota bacterium]